MKKSLTSIILLIFLVTACSPQAQATEGPIIDEEATPTPVPEELTPAQRAAVQTLSENLGLSPEEITVISTEAVEWPDSCAGIDRPEQACAQVITPGFQIILEANGRQVEYRTNEDGTVIGPATVALSWKREGGIAGFCDYMTVYLSGEIQATSCKPGNYVEKSLADVLSEEEMAQLDEWLSEYGDISIDASDPMGVSDRMTVTLTFAGMGSEQTLSPSAEQELLSFVQELHRRLYK